jgi:hypothetical protein
MTTSHGTVSRRTWRYCDKHSRVSVAEQKSATSESCLASVCGAGRRRESYGFVFTYTRRGKTLRAQGQAATRDAAVAAMAARKAELLTKATATTAAPTLAEHAAKWLVTIKPDIAKRTLKSYAETLRRHVLPTLGASQLPAITRGHVMALLSSKRADGLGKNSVRLIRAAISALFSDAVDHELIPLNPALRPRRRDARRTVASRSSS